MHGVRDRAILMRIFFACAYGCGQILRFSRGFVFEDDCPMTVFDFIVTEMTC